MLRKEQVKNMPQIISFYSPAASQGKRTLSLAFANLLANEGYSTLYVELDIDKPSVAITNQITDPLKNAVEYFKKTVKRKEFELDEFVINKNSLLESDNKHMKRVFNEFPKDLDFLVLPSGYSENAFPMIVDGEKNAEKIAHEYIQTFIYTLKSTNYHFVILNLPNNLSSIFGYEVIGLSDTLIDIVTPSANRIDENRKILNFLTNNIPELESNLKVIINQASSALDIQTYKDLLKEYDPFVINFDLERQSKELALEIGSPIIDEELERLALQLRISITPKEKKRKFFALTGRGN